MTTDPDLTEAVDAAARVHYEQECAQYDLRVTAWESAPVDRRVVWCDKVRPLVEAAAPLIAAQVRAETLREAADAWTRGAWADTPRRPDRVQDRIAAAQYVGDWLRRRAAAPTGEASRG